MGLTLLTGRGLRVGLLVMPGWLIGVTAPLVLFPGEMPTATHTGSPVHPQEHHPGRRLGSSRCSSPRRPADPRHADDADPKRQVMARTGWVFDDAVEVTHRGLLARVGEMSGIVEGIGGGSLWLSSPCRILDIADGFGIFLP